jgi:ABC-2 type transport system ATP-binding protein
LAERSMLEARGLTKRYGAFLALDRVDFQVRRGEILGYLGPNGSGKSTTVNTVVGLIEPSAGSLSLDGRDMADDPIAYRRRIGYVPEEPHLYTHLTAIEYLLLVGRLRGLSERTLAEKVPALLQLLLLWDSRYATLAAYSKGMRQRVLLAAALLHNPDLLVLDEPFSGLDVNAGLLFRTLLRMFARDRMVLFSTHRFDMVEQLCSRVVILTRGRIAAERDVASFRESGSPSLEEVFVTATEQEDFAPIARQILEIMRAT